MWHNQQSVYSQSLIMLLYNDTINVTLVWKYISNWQVQINICIWWIKISPFLFVVQLKEHPLKNGSILTLQHQPASHTGSLCERSASWQAHSAWLRWACKRPCAEAQTLGSGWHAPSHGVAAGTVSAPWPRAMTWRRQSHQPYGTLCGYGGSLAILLTKPRGMKKRQGRRDKRYFYGFLESWHFTDLYWIWFIPIENVILFLM